MRLLHAGAVNASQGVAFHDSVSFPDAVLCPGPQEDSKLPKGFVWSFTAPHMASRGSSLLLASAH